MNIQSHLQDWKTCTPRAQGGYGLAELPSDDATTVQAVIDKIKQATGNKEKIALITLRPEDGKIKDRQLVARILGKDLSRGVSTSTYSHYLRTGEQLYSMIFIDHAEYLASSAMMWICENMREATDVFILVVRDRSRLERTIERSGHESSWVFGRSFWIDLPSILE